MKLLSYFALASTVAGLAIPGPATLSPAIESAVRSTSSSVWSVLPKTLASEYPAAEFLRNMEWMVGRHTDQVDFSEAEPVEHSLDSSGPWMKRMAFTPVRELETDGRDNDKSSLTLYEMISQDEHCTVFAKFLSEFDDIVKKLNSSSSTHSVFVPTDAAFKKFSDLPNPPRKYLRSFVEYHVSPDLLPVRKVFSSRTIPTLLEENELGPYPQRISIQLGIRGLTLNYMSHVIRPDIEAKNGIIHALDHVLIPPFLASDTLNFLTSRFSSFEFGLVKTGLFDEINKTSTHTGATFFVPTNYAFKKLPAPVTGFLFSRWGEKYLRALLKYHIVFDHTLYSDSYNKPKDEQLATRDTHIDLPTLLENRHVSIDITHFNRFYSIKVNGFTKVVASDVIVKDGVTQVLNDVLIPPRKPGHEFRKQPFGDQDAMDIEHPYIEPDNLESITVDEVIERLEPFSE